MLEPCYFRPMPMSFNTSYSSYTRAPAIGGNGLYTTTMSQNFTPETRQRMRPWLEARINSGCIRGLEWLDREQKIFKVPWKHVGNREWSEDDGIIFKEWAVHTGRFREGVDQPDWPTWKTRFRCALTKLPDIRELKDRNKLDGQTEEPYRVYKFVPRNGDSNITSPAPSDVSVYSEDSPGTSPQHYPMIPSTVGHSMNNNSQSDQHMLSVGSLPSDIRDVEPQISYHSEIMDNIDGFSVGDCRGTSIEMRELEPDDGASQRQLALDLNDCKLYITVKYQLVTVFESLFMNPSGCRIYFDKELPLNPEEFEQMFGPRNAEPLRLPPSNIKNTHQQRLTMDLLNALDRGVYIRVVGGNIYATRKCRCRIYVSVPSINNSYDIIKLQRDQETLVYDVRSYFQPALERYIHQRGTKPSVEVVIGFGQHFSMDRESINSLLVSATVVHTEAHNLLSSISCTSPMSPGISVSKSDHLDRIMDVLQFTHIQPENEPQQQQCL